MPTISVRPSGISFEAKDDETVIEAAWRGGFHWPTICGGNGTCTTCVLTVVEGAEHFSEAHEWEREGLDRVVPTLPGDPAHYRLACQATVNGDVVVHKIGVKPKAEGDTVYSPGTAE